MKPKWAVVLLVVSLLGNSVELGLYARAEYLSRRQTDRFNHWVQTGAPQWHRWVVVDSFAPEMRRLQNRVYRWQAELDWQDYQQPTDSATDRLALDSVASLTRQQYDLMYRSRQALPGVNDERLRRRMEKRWHVQMGLDD
jgi:hypothetical protein